MPKYIALKPKTKIVLASLLKPVDDTRMFEKFGLSIASNLDVEVHIVGYVTSSKLPKVKNIHFHPIFNFSRISWGRATASLKYYKLLVNLKPEVIIVNSHDLLIVTILNKIIFGSKILYDVQENYFLNIMHTDAFLLVFRPFLAGWVRLKEIMFSPFINQFFLAEKIYKKQLFFIGKNYSVIENKYLSFRPYQKKESVKIDLSKGLNLVFTGTISRHYGILDAIDLANNFSNYISVQLKIIGRCANKQFLDELTPLINQNEHIIFIGGEQPIDHQEIIRAINEADMGIISYLPNKSTKGRIPTKIYEYMANELPFIALNQPDWLDLAISYNACISVSNDCDPKMLLNKIKDTTFYNTNRPLQDLFWASEEKKLLDSIQKCISQ